MQMEHGTIVLIYCMSSYVSLIYCQRASPRSETQIFCTTYLDASHDTTISSQYTRYWKLKELWAQS